MLRYLLLLACLASTGCGQLAVAGYFLLRSDSDSSSHGGGGGGGAVAVGPAGGTLSTAEATVTVPPGALSGDVTLTVAAGTQIQQLGFMTVGQPVRLGPEGQTFAQPVRVRLPFDPGALPAGSTVADLVVLKRSDATGQVTVLRPTQTGSTLVVEVTSFSTFQPAVQAGADPGTSSVAAVPSAVSADGISTSTVTVLVRDAAGRPLVGQAVALVTSSSSIAIQQPAPTGPDGRTTGTLSSGTAQVVSVTASAGSVELGRVGVQFLQPGPPPAPTLSLVSRAAFDVRLAWTPVLGATSYRLELPGPLGTEVILGADTTTYTDTSIGLDQGWGYRVFSVNAYGSTPSNTVTVFPAPPTSTRLVDRPPVVDLVAPTAGDAIAGVTTITWTTTDSNPSRAEVQLSADGGATWPQVLYEGPDTGSVSWDSSDVPDGTRYRIRVTATDTNGNRSVPAASGDFQATRTDHRLSWVKVTEPIHDLVALRPDGEIYVVGTLTSARDLVFGPGEVNERTLPQAPAGSQYRYLARYDSAGALRWAVQVGAGATHAVVAAPVVTADGGVLLAGQNTSGTSLTLGSAGGTQIALTHDACFVARYDSAGELLWVRELHDAPYGAQVTSDSSLLGLELYPDGSYVVAGRFSGGARPGRDEPVQRERRQHRRVRRALLERRRAAVGLPRRPGHAAQRPGPPRRRDGRRHGRVPAQPPSRAGSSRGRPRRCLGRGAFTCGSRPGAPMGRRAGSSTTGARPTRRP